MHNPDLRKSQDQIFETPAATRKNTNTPSMKTGEKFPKASNKIPENDESKNASAHKKTDL